MDEEPSSLYPRMKLHDVPPDRPTTVDFTGVIRDVTISFEALTEATSRYAEEIQRIRPYMYWRLGDVTNGQSVTFNYNMTVA